MTWTFIWMAVVLKIPIVALIWICWWAINAEPEPAAEEQPDDGGGTGLSPCPRKPRPPRRGDHAELPLRPPARTRATSSDSVPRP